MKRNAYADTTIKATAKRLKHLQKNCNLNKPEHVKTFIANKKCGNAFKIKDLEQQTIYTTAMLTIGELFYLKLQILNLLNPKDKLYNYFSYTYIRRLYNLYATWLIDACKESKENSEKALKEIDLMIQTFREKYFEKNPEAEEINPDKNSIPLLDFD